MYPKKPSMRFFIFSCLFSSFFNVSIAKDAFFKSFDGTQIAYTDEGDGEVVVLIHGFINTRKSFDNTAIKKVLLADGYRVIIPDLRGNGDSDKPQEESAYANDAEVKDLIALVDHLRLNKYKAIGYSRGSILLAKLLTVDGRIKKAVLGGMGIDFTNPEWERRIMFMNGFAGKVDENPATKGAVDYATSIGADLHILSLLQKYQPVTSIAEIGEVRCKVMVIVGKEDTENGSPQELARAFKKGQALLVQGDHNTTYRKGPFAAGVLSFF